MSHHDHGSDNGHKDGDHEYGHHHILSNVLSRRTLVTLLVLTIITVAASRIDLGGGWNFILAMLIASAKALIVTLFFMGLKYDAVDNRAFFYSSSFFVLVFILLSAADIFTRPVGWQVGTADIYLQTKAVGGPDIPKPWEKSDAILAHGKKLFEANCAVCHGPEGLGNGPGSNLPIKPRNFHETANWKNPRRPSALFKMLETGIPPFMPAYGQLPPTDRWGVVHYVLSFGPPPDAEDAKTLAAVGILDPSRDDGGVAAGPKKRTIPIDFAIQRYIDASN